MLATARDLLLAKRGAMSESGSGSISIEKRKVSRKGAGGAKKDISSSLRLCATSAFAGYSFVTFVNPNLKLTHYPESALLDLNLSCQSNEMLAVG